MCWRGHGDEHIRLGHGKRNCRKCHKLRMRAYRFGRAPVLRPLFALNVDTFNRIKRRVGWTDKTVCIFSGVNMSTLNDYKRGSRDGRRRALRATREKAAAISQAVHCDFSQLWSSAR